MLRLFYSLMVSLTLLGIGLPASAQGWGAPEPGWGQVFEGGNPFNQGWDSSGQGWGSPRPRGQVVVYEHCGYGGRSATLDVGEYSDVRDYGIGNDAISSIRVSPGLQVTFYADRNFRGGSTTISNDMQCLDRIGWNDRITSMRISSGGSYGGGWGSHPSRCVDWRLIARGPGAGGIRDTAHVDDFRRVSNGEISGRYCGSGAVRIEYSKNHPGGDVTLIANGQQYRFGPGDQPDREQNNWLRRFVDVPVH